MGGINPAGIFHYNIKIENSFGGFMQHVMNNQSVGVRTDMTTVCAIGPDDCAANPSSSCQAASISALTMEFTGSLEADEDADYVKYENAAGGASTFRVLSTETADLQVEVLGADSAQSFEQFSGISGKSYTRADGALWLKVFSASGKGHGNYTIRADRTAPAAAVVAP